MKTVSKSTQRNFLFAGLFVVAIAGSASVARFAGWIPNSISGVKPSSSGDIPVMQASLNETTESESGIRLQNVTVFRLGAFDTPMIPRNYTATIAARRKSQLAFLAAERIVDISVDEGEVVSEGDVLARQDDVAVAAQLAAAVAILQGARSRLNELNQGPRQQTIATARALLEQRRAQQSLAEAQLSRQMALRRTNSTSEQEFDTARFSQQSAEAATQATEEQLNELLAGTRTEQIDAQEATVAGATADVERLTARLAQTQLVAPFAGRISKRFLDEGVISSPNAPVLELVETDHLEVRFGATPNIASQISRDDTIQFVCDGRAFSATVRQIQPTLNAATRTQEIILDVLPADSQRLVDGQTARVEFAVADEAAGIWVPSDALQPQVRGLWSVLVLDAEPDTSPSNATVSRRDVELLSTWGRWSRVRGTLEDDETVVLAGANRLSSGQRVQAEMIDVLPPWHATNRLHEAPTGDLR
jgi:multidrug efflux pump subunit AcrA (membrane-fusion protein)